MTLMDSKRINITNFNVPSYKKYFPVLLTPRRISKLAIAVAVEPVRSPVIENARLDSIPYRNSRASNVCVNIINSEVDLIKKLISVLLTACLASPIISNTLDPKFREVIQLNNSKISIISGRKTAATSHHCVGHADYTPYSTSKFDYLFFDTPCIFIVSNCLDQSITMAIHIGTW